MEKPAEYNIRSSEIVRFINDQFLIAEGELSLYGGNGSTEKSLDQMIATANNVGRLAILQELSELILSKNPENS
ncbi:MAG: hypothetical protein WCI37_03495 [bacterium]